MVTFGYQINAFTHPSISILKSPLSSKIIFVSILSAAFILVDGSDSFISEVRVLKQNICNPKNQKNGHYTKKCYLTNFQAKCKILNEPR